MNGGGGGGGMGTLQALLTELSGLKKPRGFINRVVRRALGMKPKPPPHYRILVMMATNMPYALDEALLRPGRIDRIYRVGYPSKAGRVRTYEGYLAKVSHELTAEQIDKLATITPYATGATIKDLVNEALIIAIRDGRDVITYQDVIKAKQLKELGPPEDVEYIERERHAVAIHEACHAVVAYRTRQHMEIDIATIEKGSDYLGMVSSIKPEDQFTRWRSEYESDILVALASLAGERMFFDSDSSSGVSGDLDSATTVAVLHGGVLGHGQDGDPPPPRPAASRRARRAAATGPPRPGAGSDGTGPRRSAGSRTGSRTTWACCSSRPRRSCATTSGTCSRSRTRSRRTRRSAARTSPRCSRAGAARSWTARRTRTTRSSPGCATTTWRPSARTRSTTSRRCRMPVAEPAPSPLRGHAFPTSSSTRQRQRGRTGRPEAGEAIDFGGFGAGNSNGNGSYTGPLGAPTYDPPGPSGAGRPTTRTITPNDSAPKAPGPAGGQPAQRVDAGRTRCFPGRARPAGPLPRRAARRHRLPAAGAARAGLHAGKRDPHPARRALAATPSCSGTRPGTPPSTPGAAACSCCRFTSPRRGCPGCFPATSAPGTSSSAAPASPTAATPPARSGPGCAGCGRPRRPSEARTR